MLYVALPRTLFQLKKCFCCNLTKSWNNAEGCVWCDDFVQMFLQNHVLLVCVFLFTQPKIWPINHPYWILASNYSELIWMPNNYYCIRWWKINSYRNVFRSLKYNRCLNEMKYERFIISVDIAKHRMNYFKQNVRNNSYMLKFNEW